jgi:NADH-quinone oxidoreductase subunit E
LNKLLETYPDEIARILTKYPAEQKRSAVMPLLYLAQRKLGYVTRLSINEIAEIAGVSPTEVMSLVGFYTLYHDDEGPRYRLQVCTDLSCALRGADEFLEKLCHNLGLKVGEISPDGLIMVEEVTCLAGCDRAPMLQLQGDGEITYHENLSVESASKLVDDLRRNANGGSGSGKTSSTV